MKYRQFSRFTVEHIINRKSLLPIKYITINVRQ